MDEQNHERIFERGKKTSEEMRESIWVSQLTPCEVFAKTKVIQS